MRGRAQAGAQPRLADRSTEEVWIRGERDGFDRLVSAPAIDRSPTAAVDQRHNGLAILWPRSSFALGPLSGPPPAWASGQSAKPERQGEGHERKDLDRRDAGGDSRISCGRARDWRHHRYRAEARGRR